MKYILRFGISSYISNSTLEKYLLNNNKGIYYTSHKYNGLCFRLKRARYIRLIRKLINEELKIENIIIA